MSFLTAEKKDRVARCPAGGSDLSGQCPFKNVFSVDAFPKAAISYDDFDTTSKMLQFLAQKSGSMLNVLSHKEFNFDCMKGETLKLVDANIPLSVKVD